MKAIKNFVKNTFKDIPKEKREEVIDNVTESLVEKVEDLIEQGLTEQEAIDKTVMEFGSVEDYFEEEIKPEGKTKILKTIYHYRNDLLFSICSAAIIIGILIFANLYYFPSVIWFVIPSLAVLFWPLAIMYNLLNKKENRRGNKNE